MQDLKPINSPDSLFHDGNPATGELGTIVSADWLNGVQSAAQELLTVIKNSGQTPDSTRQDQLLQAVRNIAWGGNSKPTTLAGYGIADGASKTDLQKSINDLVAGAPGALDTLQELAAALGNDQNFAASVAKQLGGKADKATTLAGYGITDGATLTQLKVATPPGQVAYFAMPAAPEGWLKADGNQVSKTTYRDLYSAIGQLFSPIDPMTQVMLRLDANDGVQARIGGAQLSVYGGAGMSTEQGKFGNVSLKTVAGGGYAAFGQADPFNPNAFTLEGWHYPTFAGTGGSNGYSAAWVVGMNASTVAGEISIAIDRASRAPIVWLGNNGGFFANASLGTAGIFAIPRWYHIAFSYDGSTYRLFVDGIQVWSLASTTRVAIPDNTLLFAVDGGAPTASGSTTAYYQDWKVSKVSRYTGNFAVPTTPVRYQVALLHKS
ncbi:LamG-like jellyroll fold domain-containing protein [Chromobacterium violaceum]|uniref:Phage Tail Collar Domain n=1 Tax=Chromobacterium violaceum TaxID=536 RepID=A0AAX2MF37_CHRVL|nr:LamG-like jellyroll fold domain-containing protein [Chromobacterium violaceum]OLZ74941.1 hypothetical protein BS642_20050 [Chromobacterium violaceum]STB69811.1 Phage Tail Collar Domain [Chromobacterium violaceum]SUX35166.1 Phage Tail Collar Domain [Chromobacterium violaceum]